MIKYAKVSLSAIKQLYEAVIIAREFSPKFDNGKACLEELRHAFENTITELESSAAKMNNSLSTLNSKIKEIEKCLSELRKRKSDLEKELSNLEAELAETSPTITLTDEDGDTYEEPNPAYEDLCIEIAAVNSQISAVEMEIAHHEQRLNHANSLKNQLNGQSVKVNNAAFSLGEKCKICTQLKENLDKKQNSNLRQGTSAAEGLKKIEEIINIYLGVKMKYTPPVQEAKKAGNVILGSAVKILQGINEIVHENISSEADELLNEDETVTNNFTEKTAPDVVEKEAPQHIIKYNREGRICEYDGRTYGGIYNTYEDRLRKTAVDNPIRGFYEGSRGESKFIPTGRSAEGIAVLEILKQYGLDGIVYRNAEPDFEVCSEAIVVIEGMTENRENYFNSEGFLMPGNFSQADIALAKKWNEQRYLGKTDWTDEDIYVYRKAKNLTWHEKCDTRTMVLVRSEINLFFNHSGGCSECRTRDASLNAEEEFDE